MQIDKIVIARRLLPTKQSILFSGLLRFARNDGYFAFFSASFFSSHWIV